MCVSTYMCMFVSMYAFICMHSLGFLIRAHVLASYHITYACMHAFVHTYMLNIHRALNQFSAVSLFATLMILDQMPLERLDSVTEISRYMSGAANGNEGGVLVGKWEVHLDSFTPVCVV